MRIAEKTVKFSVAEGSNPPVLDLCGLSWLIRVKTSASALQHMASDTGNGLKACATMGADWLTIHAVSGFMPISTGQPMNFLQMCVQLCSAGASFTTDLAEQRSGLLSVRSMLGISNVQGNHGDLKPDIARVRSVEDRAAGIAWRLSAVQVCQLN